MQYQYYEIIINFILVNRTILILVPLIPPKSDPESRRSRTAAAWLPPNALGGKYESAPGPLFLFSKTY